MNQFRSLTVSGWRQFKDVRIDFHPRLTIITGANGAGKSTLLSLLSRHFGYSRAFLSTPSGVNRSGITQYSMGLFNWLKKRIERSDPSQRVIGRIEYTGGGVANLVVGVGQALSYDVGVPGQQPVAGLHVDSHRAPNLYRHVPSMPTTAATIDALATGFTTELRHHYGSGGTQQGSLFHLKSALINMAVFGYGNAATAPNQNLIEIYEGFQEILLRVLPESIGFQKLSVRTPEVILETKSGDFVIDAASGGIIKLIEITWQLYLFSISNNYFVATMDEPENHLHPAMQRTFLTNLVDAFPNVQFVVVTHSPFVVSSVRDSVVVVLKYEDLQFTPDDRGEDPESVEVTKLGSRVVSINLDPVNKAGTALEVLREALGVPTTVPEWADERLREIVANYRNSELSQETLDQMYDQLETEGLVGEYPTAVRGLTKS